MVWVSSEYGIGVLRVQSRCSQSMVWVSSVSGLGSYLCLTFVLFSNFRKNVSIQKLIKILKYVHVISHLICMSGAKHCIVRYLFY